VKILLVRPKPHPESIGLQTFMICEPLELEYLCASVAGLGHEIEILDMILEKEPLEHFLRLHRPQLVGFTAYITHVGVVKDYARAVKAFDPGCVTVVGGVHAEVVPEDFADPSLDFVVCANGLKAFRELVQGLQQGTLGPGGRLAGQWRPGEPRPALDLDHPVPIPDRTKTARYRARYNYIFHDRCALLKTSSGCAFRCDFCFCVQITQHALRERPLPEVVEELRGLSEKNVFIVDDNFLHRRERVLEFVRLLRERKIEKNYILFGRSDFISRNEDVIAELAQVGLRAVFVGVESFEDKELGELKRGITLSTNLEAVRILEKHGVEPYCGIIVGMDWEDRHFTDLARRLNTLQWPVVNIQPLTPMPGTPLYERLAPQIAVPRDRHELWDMAHVLMRPTRMTVRRFYLNIIRTYLTSSIGLRAHWALARKYGARIYARCLKGVLYILGQYLRLAMKG